MHLSYILYVPHLYMNYKALKTREEHCHKLKESSSFDTSVAWYDNQH